MLPRWVDGVEREALIRPAGEQVNELSLPQQSRHRIFHHLHDSIACQAETVHGDDVAEDDTTICGKQFHVTNGRHCFARKAWRTPCRGFERSTASTKAGSTLNLARRTPAKNARPWRRFYVLSSRRIRTADLSGPMVDNRTSLPADQLLPTGRCARRKKF